MSGGQDTGIARVAGGPTSVMADLDDLEHACVGLERLEPALESLRLPLRGWAEELPAHAEVAPAVTAAAGRLRELEVNAVKVQEIARTTATSVRMSVDRYRAAERGARHAVERAQYAAGEALDHVWAEGQDGFSVDEAEWLVRNSLNSIAESGLATAVTAGLFGGAMKLPGIARHRELFDAKASARAAKSADPEGKDGRSRVSKLVAQGRTLGAKQPLADPAGALAGWVMDGPVGDAYDEVVNWENATEVLAEALTVVAMDQPVDVVGEVEQVSGGPSRLDGGVGDLMALQDQASGAGPGRIAVTQVRAADGRDTYIVAIPGTQAGVPLEERHRVGADGLEYMNFIDVWGIADAVGRRSERTGEAVAQALAKAGVPDGARIVPAGHSQGGLHAVNLLSHESLAERYEMAGAYTYGAPTANLRTPEGTPVLHLEDEHDLTAAADGGPNPATVDRVTVTLSSTPTVTTEEFQQYVEHLGRLRADRDLAAVQDGYEAAQELPAHLGDVPERLMEHHHLSSYRDLVEAQEARGPEAWGAAAGTVATLGRMTQGRVVAQKTVALGRREPQLMQQERRHRPQQWPYNR